MKKLILIAALSLGLINQNAYGQAFSVQHDTVSALGMTGNVINLHNMITTTQSADVLLQWQVVEHNLPAGWMNIDLGICDNKLCYPSSVFGGTTQQIDTVRSSKSIDLKLIVNPGPENGTYYVKVFIRDLANTMSTTTTYVISKWATSVSNVSRNEDNVTLYPNPAREDLNVRFDGQAGVKNIAVYNLIGKMVSIYKVQGNSAKLNLNNIPSGIYFVRLLDGNGRIIATRKFTHQ